MGDCAVGWVRGAVVGACAAAACGLLTGCKGARPAALELEVLTRTEATAALHAAALLGEPAEGAEHAEAKGEGGFAAAYLEDRGVIRIERERRGADIVERRLLLEEGGEPTPLVESLYRLNEDGDLVLVEEINHDEDVEVVFDPPLVVMPQTLAPGARFEQKLTMTVHPLGDRSRVKARGPVISTVTYEGRERISIPAGEFDAAKVVAVFEAVLNIARVTNTTEEWIAVGDTGGTPVPLLAERREEVTRVLLPSTKRRLLVLLEATTEE